MYNWSNHFIWSNYRSLKYKTNRPETTRIINYKIKLRQIYVRSIRVDERVLLRVSI